MSAVIDFYWLLKSRLGTKLTEIKYHYERNVREALGSIHGRIFWDIGADVGQYSLLLHKNFEEVIAVEPSLDALRVLRLGIRLSRVQNIKVYPIAISNIDGETRFYTNLSKIRFLGIHAYPASLLERFEYRTSDLGKDMDYVGEEFISVKTAKFDSLSTQPADLVKLDVEGAEFLALEGMHNSLQRKKIRNLLVELHDRTKRDELETLLLDYDFDLRWVDREHLLASLD